jgi:acetylornithine deacetylase/succinyl-diaminopimelate desuccinylase-like protein
MLSAVEHADALTWARDELIRQVQITSYPTEEHAFVTYLADRAEGLGIPVARQPVAGAADNLLLGWDPTPRLLLTAHVDTIRPEWPWDGRAHVDGDRVFGLGAQDDKGCVVAALLAFEMAREEGVDLTTAPVGIGLCVDEEVGGTGSIAMAEWLRPALVVGLEGTELQLGLAEAGFVEFRANFAGRAVHGALREEGDNALERAVAFSTALQDAPFARHVHPTCGRNIPMVWELHGGQRLNVVPDRAEVHVDIRVTPAGPSAEQVLADVRAIAAHCGARIDVIEISEPFETAPDAPLAAALGDAAASVRGGAPEPIGMLAWTDAHNFHDLAGSEVVVFGPGHLRDAHRPDESVALHDVVECARVLATLLATPVAHATRRRDTSPADRAG